MNALSTAAAFLTVAAIIPAIDSTQGQMPSRVHWDVNAALSRHESRATGAGNIAASITNGANSTHASCSHGREAMYDASTPTAFAAIAAQDGMTEVALGVLALRRSRNCHVRQFAQRMVQDHGQALQELQSLVERKGLILPTRLNAKYQAMVGSLNRKSNAAFDKAYLRLVGKDHAQVIAWFESASSSIDSDVAGFAHKTLQTLQEHKELAEHLHASIGTATAGAR
jgi:putative membrane protein